MQRGIRANANTNTCSPRAYVENAYVENAFIHPSKEKVINNTNNICTSQRSRFLSGIQLGIGIHVFEMVRVTLRTALLFSLITLVRVNS